MEESSQELLHGDGSARKFLFAHWTIEPLHLAGALQAGQVAGDTLQYLGWRLQGLVADRTLWARHHLALGRQLGQVTVELLVLRPQQLHLLVLRPVQRFTVD